MNNVFTILFHYLLPFFRQLHNSIFPKHFIFLSKELFQVPFTIFQEVEIFSIKRILQRPKEMNEGRKDLETVLSVDFGLWPLGAPEGCGERAECTRSLSKAPRHALLCLPPNPAWQSAHGGHLSSEPPKYYLKVSRILWRRQRLFAKWTFYPDTAGPQQETKEGNAICRGKTVDKSINSVWSRNETYVFKPKIMAF